VICDRYDVVVVPFPFDEIPVRKRRPVLVFSGRQFNEANDHTVVAMITTAKETSWPSDVVINDLAVAGLLTPCVARLRFQTMPNELISRQLGKLGPLDRLQCEKQLAGMLS
jgi:mRNA interferase MazF